MDEKFQNELQQLLNKYSIDTFAHTPDFLLAEHIVQYLKNYKSTIETTAKWQGWYLR